MKKCVSEEFIKFCDDKFPGMKNNAGYRKFFMYLCFGTYTHEITGKLAISYLTLARFAGKEESAKNKNFKAYEFLQNFQADVLPEFTWLDPHQIKDSEDGYGECSWNSIDPCRSVDCLGLDEETKNMIAKEVGFTGAKYYFIDRKLFSRKNAAVEKKGTLASYENDAKCFNLNATQQSIYDGVKTVSLNGNAFTQKLNKNLDKINVAIDNMQTDVEDKISLEEKKAKQHKVIDAIKEDPRVFYRPTPLSRTCRLHHSSECVVSLEKSVRKAFCSGWTEGDLMNSQFVILAAILDAPLSKAFIQSGQNLWKYLNDFAFGVNEKPSSEVKSVFKKVIYGICFGTGRARLKATLKLIKAEKLIKCPIIQELLQKREQWFMNINSDGYVLDMWNNKHEIEKGCTKKDIYSNLVATPDRWAGSLAATKIQSIEMEIIESAFEYLKKNGEKYQCQVTVFQHDGFTISYNKKEWQKMIQDQIREAIKKRAKKVGDKLGLDLSGVDIEFTDL